MSIETKDLVNQLQTPAPDTGFFGHPAGLSTLFFTELWERFSYYGMRAILMLYMVAQAKDGGLAMDTRTAAAIYSTYTMSVYLGAIPGGLLADRFLGAKLSVLIGGIIIALGHFTLAIPSLPAFYTGLTLIVIGTGLLKPNISTIVGSLYTENDPRRDGGFSIFYMGINIGATLSPLACGFLAQSPYFKQVLSSWGLEPQSSWHWGFAAAGIGMLIGLGNLILFRKNLAGIKAARVQPKATTGTAPAQPLNANEWKRLAALFVLFFFTILFWSVYEQGGISLNLFADKLTDNKISGWQFPSSWYQSLQGLFVVILAPLFSLLWIKLGDRQPGSAAKFAWGLALLGSGTALMIPASVLAASHLVSPLWLCACYLLQVAGEMCLSPVGLSTVTKLAPIRLVGLIMGCWFLAASLGNRLAGYIGGFFNEKDPGCLIFLFGGMAGAALVAALLLALLAPAVNKLANSHNTAPDTTPDTAPEAAA